VINLVGPDHVGLGTDFFGLERAPTGFVGMHELPAVTAGLVERGHSDEVILKALGGNYLRIFDQIWK
jgi:membrane dipeptidase